MHNKSIKHRAALGSYMKYLLSLLVLLSLNAWSCSCLETNLNEYFEQCEQIFVARLSDIKETITEDSVTTEIGVLKNPQEVIKGDPSMIVELKNVNAGTSCDSNLYPGKHYLICGVSEPQVELMPCGKTSVLYYEQSWEIVEKIKAIKNGKSASE